ncbi:MAG: hypothetical protein ABJO52_04875, partial [Nisaea sp.]|uniref:hypothetical protein n=1 Tax=Nisaea sp. TaxID=2024842 RepID=UPI00329839B4
LQQTELAVADDAMARQSTVDNKTGGFRGDKKFGAGGTKEGASGKKKESARDRAAKAKSKVHKPHLDEMTNKRTEVPLAKGPLPTKPTPIVQADDAPHLTPRGKIGTGSYEDPTDEKKRRGRPKKSGRPGR